MGDLIRLPPFRPVVEADVSCLIGRRTGWSTHFATFRMLSFYSIGLITFLSSLYQVQADIECSDCCPVAGSAFNLTCTGVTDGNCDWFKDGSTVMQCFAGGNCFPTVTGYTGYRVGDREYVLQIDSLDKATHDGLIKCNQAGTDYFLSLEIVTAKPSNDLSGTCQDGAVECTLTNHGDPAVTLQLKDGSTVLTSNNTGGRVSHAGEDGKTYTCELNETTCVTNTRKDVTCQATTISPTTPPVPGDTDCLIILIIIIIIIVILVLALIIFHIVIFYVKVSFKVMGILFFVNVILAVAAIIIGIVGIVAFALCEVIAAIIAIVIGVLTHLYKFFLSKHVLKKADVPHRHLCVCFYAYPWKTDDGDAPNGDAPDAPTNTPATVETIGESSSGNSRGTRNQETVLLTNKTTNSQETDERKDGNKATPAEYGNMNMNIPALGLQSNQGKAQTGDGNGGQTGNETSKSEKGEKKKGSKKKKSKKKKEKQDGSQSPPAVSVSGVAVDDPKTAEEPEEQIRSDSNLTKVVG